MNTLRDNFENEFPTDKVLTTVFKNKGYTYFSNGNYKECEVYKLIEKFSNKFGYTLSEEVKGESVKVICTDK